MPNPADHGGAAAPERPSVARLLTRLLLFAQLPALLAAGALAWMAYEWAGVLVMRRVNEQVLDLSTQTSALVRRVQAGLGELAWQLPAQGVPLAAFHRALVEQARELPVDAIVLARAGGEVIVHSAYPAAAPPPQPVPPALLEVARNGTMHISGVLPDPHGDRLVIGIGVPVMRPGEEVLVLTALLSLPRLQSLVDSLQLPPHWRALAIDGEGRVIVRTPGAGPQPGEVLAPGAWQRPAATGAPSGVDDQGWTAGYRTSALTGWTSIVRAPQGELLGLVWRPLLALLLGMVLVLALAVGASLRLHRRVDSSVRQLRDAAMAMPEGHVPAGPMAFREADDLAGAIDASGRAVREATWRLRRSEERLSAILHTARSAIIVTDEHHHVQLFNAAAQEMFHYRPGEIMGRSVERLFTPPGWHVYLAEARQAAGTGALGPVTTTAVRCLRRHDGSFPAEFSVASGTGAPGERFYTITLHDVTERMRFQASLIAARDEVERIGLHFEHRLLQEMDRRQAEIAAELHDAVGSAVVGASMLLEATRAQMADPPRATALLARAQQQVALVAERVRQLARGIMPAGSDAGALNHALEQYAIDASELLGIRCSLRTRGLFDDVPPVAAGHVYRIVQEAITNALRHGRASKVQIRLARAGGCCSLRVVDNGIGCDPRLAMGGQAGIGLRSMRARAHALGGRLTLNSRRAGGCEVHLRWACNASGVPGPEPFATPRHESASAGVEAT